MRGAHVSVSVDPVHRGLDRVRCRLAVLLVCSCAFLPFSSWPPTAHQPHSNAQGCHSLTLSGCAVSPFSVCSSPCVRHCRAPHFSLCPASPLCRGTLGVHFRGHLFHSHTVCACTRTHAFRAAQAWRCQWRGARVLSRSFLGHLFSLETPATCGGLVCGLYGTYAEKKGTVHHSTGVSGVSLAFAPPPPSRTWGSSLAFEAPSAKFVTSLPPQTLIGCTVAQEAHAYTARLLRFSMTPLRPVFFICSIATNRIRHSHSRVSSWHGGDAARRGTVCVCPRVTPLAATSLFSLPATFAVFVFSLQNSTHLARLIREAFSAV